ncbi:MULTISPECIES: MurR/RpiR family transcriptional regulator [Lactococcus]|uniref:MurR/RpiR family transcriptional regulator n=1 Tax=Lactococcus TaxID=1357 RepID=UPI00129D6762|nr:MULTISPECIES: MurR/RpiR family transcriptional regulator [Lactococcus]MDC0815417.1 MurR/RpiR family transcriptional regulator [Lactococcus petauri]MDC0817286.1 MurR/RpiR family transcriptional regulator [Lactococcus petauri]MDC0824164.1 MurR/RpiR family transcriptional regulator [Lactococcus petauri]MDC0830180.1 MurR/RpiR family transcriptional regulator [Lactococcus petauri]NHI79100.1 MurR/RpiR family transcriptional regulator [Lactococcus petauri]
MNIRMEIKQNYEALNQSQKRVADTFLRHPDVLTMSIAEIAAQSDTSASAITRFVRKFGYEGLDTFRIAMAQSSNAIASNEIIEIDPIVQKNDDLSTIIDKVAVMLSTTVSDTANFLDEKVIQEAISALKKARRIYLIGVGSSGVIAYDLAHKFNRAGFLALHSWDGHMVMENLAYLNEQDVVLSFSYSGETKEVLAALDIARERGAQSYIVTKNQSNEISKRVSGVIAIPTTEHLLRVGAIASFESSFQVATVLYLGVIEEMIGPKLTKRMKKTAENIKKIK